MTLSPEALRELLRLIVITDEKLAAPRSVETVIREALAGGARAIQLRSKASPASEMLALCRTLKDMAEEAGALLFVNDRLDVALAGGAHGVHLGSNDLPVARVRAHTQPGFLIGYSANHPDAARQAERDGADYIGCGPVFFTSTKASAGTPIGLERLAEVARVVTIPVIGIGGITAERVVQTAQTGASGVAVISAVMEAADPKSLVEDLLAPYCRL